jgi:hypothetical protein
MTRGISVALFVCLFVAATLGAVDAKPLPALRSESAGQGIMGSIPANAPPGWSDLNGKPERRIAEPYSPRFADACHYRQIRSRR